MHLLRDEDNARYRTVMKNTLEFDPEILKRYVNFMNNPDERTAVDQFGKDDKYSGICTLMATMPGLPIDRKSTRLNSSHANISYAVFCLKKKRKIDNLPWP